VELQPPAAARVASARSLRSAKEITGAPIWLHVSNAWSGPIDGPLVTCNDRTMPWTIDEIQEVWLGGERVSLPPEDVVRSFAAAEQVRGRMGFEYDH
jgi:hypothetical protein